MTVSAGPVPLQSSWQWRRWAPGACGILLVLAVWWFLALTVLQEGGAVPTPAQVVSQFIDDGWAFYSVHVAATVSSAAQGFLWGNLFAVGVAVLVLLVPALETTAMQIAIASYCLPIMAVGPILVIVFTGRTPMIALAALSVFFTTVVAMVLGLRSTDPAMLDVVRTAGGGRWQQLWRVQGVASLPSLVSGLKLAVPASILGAIIGEFLGTQQTGLGVAMVIAQQQLEVARTWGIAFAAGALAGVGYLILELVERIAFPWAGEGR